MSSRARRRPTVTVAASTALAAAFLLTGCANGFDAATNKPYVPDDGISLDAGDAAARNVMLVADPGKDVSLEATLISKRSSDALVSATLGEPAVDGRISGGQVAVPLNSPVAIGTAGAPTVTFPGAQAKPGTWVPVTLVFRDGGEATGKALVRTNVVTTPTVVDDHSGEAAGH